VNGKMKRNRGCLLCDFVIFIFIAGVMIGLVVFIRNSELDKARREKDRVKLSYEMQARKNQGKGSEISLVKDKIREVTVSIEESKLTLGEKREGLRVWQEYLSNHNQEDKEYSVIEGVSYSLENLEKKVWILIEECEALTNLISQRKLLLTKHEQALCKMKLQEEEEKARESIAKSESEMLQVVSDLREVNELLQDPDENEDFSLEEVDKALLASNSNQDDDFEARVSQIMNFDAGAQEKESIQEGEAAQKRNEDEVPEVQEASQPEPCESWDERRYQEYSLDTSRNFRILDVDVFSSSPRDLIIFYTQDEKEPGCHVAFSFSRASLSRMQRKNLPDMICPEKNFGKVVSLAKAGVKNFWINKENPAFVIYHSGARVSLDFDNGLFVLEEKADIKKEI